MYYPIDSNPATAFSDRDGLTDLEERRLGTPPLDPNADDDQFTDFADPDPYTENIPPNITVYHAGTTTGKGSLIVRGADENGIADVDATYIRENGFTQNYGAPEGDAGDRTRNLTTYPAPNADILLANASDTNGNIYSVRIDVKETGGVAEWTLTHADMATSSVPAAGIAYAPETAFGAGAAVSGTTVLGAGIVVGVPTAVLIALTQQSQSYVEENTYPASLTPTPVVYESSETGYRVHQGLFSAENGVERGYGWQYIDQRSELTQSELEKLLSLEEEVEVGYIKTTKIKATDTTTYVLAQRGGPDQTEVWILRLAGAEAVRAAKQQIDRATDEASPLLDNAEDYVSAEEVGAVRKLNQGDPSARIATLAGQDTRETYDDLEVADKERFGKTLAEAGEEGWLEGEDITAVVEAVDEGRIRAKQVADAGDRIDALDDPEIAQETVGKKPVLGFEFIAELDSSADAKAFFSQADSAQQVADFLNATDTGAKEIIDEAVPTEYGNILDLSGPEQEVMAEVVLDGELKGKDQLASDNVVPKEVRRVSDEEDLTDLKLIAKDADDNVVYLSPSDWQHILDRHFRGTEISSNAEETSFFPSGKTAVSRGSGPSADLPSLMKKDDLRPLMKKTIEQSRRTGGSYQVKLNSPEYGITHIQVNIEGNKIVTSYPNKGMRVKRWNWTTGQWEEWTGSKWVKWTDPYN